MRQRFDLTSLINEVRAFSLFNELSDKEIRKILSFCVFEECKSGTIIEGPDVEESLYFVLKGRAELYFEESGRELLLRSLSDCNMLLEFCLNKKFSHRVKLSFLKKSQIMSLSLNKFSTIYRKEPKLYGVFISNLLLEMIDDYSSASGLLARIFFERNATVGVPVHKPDERQIWCDNTRSKILKSTD